MAIAPAGRLLIGPGDDRPFPARLARNPMIRSEWPTMGTFPSVGGKNDHIPKPNHLIMIIFHLILK
jgi:hypothetical protein